jgi:regulator of replication initiation timing
MKSLITPLFVLLTFALVAALLVQERQAKIFDAQVSDLTQKLMNRERQGKEQEAKTASLEENLKILKTESEALRERLHTISSAPPEVRPDAAPSPTPSEPKSGFSGMLKKMMADPQLKKAIAQQEIGALRQNYAPFVQQAGISPQDAEKFYRILAQRQEAKMDARASAGGGTPQIPKDYREELKALLGDERAAQFEGFEKTLPGHTPAAR